MFGLTTDTWPVEGENPSVRQALEEMKDRFVPNELPAYDLDGNLIHPSEWKSKLEEIGRAHV